MFVKDIERLGLTEKEAKVYLTSLRIGPASMQVLARKAKVDRGTAYHVAQTLTEKKLFGITEEGKRPLFRVTHPGQLYQYVENQKIKADAQFAAVQIMIDDLQTLYDVGAEN
jgi:HTH-type transcriptional regulator, sugar sensing transcriptional regulator